MSERKRPRPLIFTEFIRGLARRDEPDSELFDELWSVLRGALVAELRRRSLWNASPGCLGIVGARGWSDDALEELLHDCYISVFLERLPGLEAQLRVKENVEGLIFRNIRDFLYTVQKRHDPVGARVFERLRATVRGELETGRLHVHEGSERIANDTVLGFTASAEAAPVPAEEVHSRVAAWNDDLLPDLVTARGSREKERLSARIAAHLAELAEAGIASYRFKDVVDALKKDTRRRWRTVHAQASGETALEELDDGAVGIVRMIRPDAGLEERQGFEALLACMEEQIEKHEAAAKTRTYLGRLWTFLRDQATEDTDETRPSQRRLAELLRIPRERFRELYDTLRRWLEACLAATSGNRPL